MTQITDLFYLKEYEKIKKLIEDGSKITTEMLILAIIDEEVSIATHLIKKKVIDRTIKINLRMDSRFIQKGNKLNLEYPVHKFYLSPLKTAIMKKDYQIIKLLLRKRAQISFSIIDEVVLENNFNMIKFFTDNSSDFIIQFALYLLYTNNNSNKFPFIIKQAKFFFDYTLSKNLINLDKLFEYDRWYTTHCQEEKKIAKIFFNKLREYKIRIKINFSKIIEPVSNEYIHYFLDTYSSEETKIKCTSPDGAIAYQPLLHKLFDNYCDLYEKYLEKEEYSYLYELYEDYEITYKQIDRIFNTGYIPNFIKYYIFSIIKHKNFNPNIKSIDGETFLHRLLKNNFHQIDSLPKNTKFDLSIEDKNGLLPEDIINKLIKNGIGGNFGDLFYSYIRKGAMISGYESFFYTKKVNEIYENKFNKLVEVTKMTKVIPFLVMKCMIPEFETKLFD